MLYHVTIENFGAIRDRQQLDLTISGKVEEEPDRQLFAASIRVPKVSVILGANASGKTTALRAVGFLADFTTRSALYPANASLYFHPFWDEASRQAPTTLSVEFAADWLSADSPALFRYTLTARAGRNERLVEREQLETKTSAQWSTLMDRQGSNVVFKRQFAKLSGTVPSTALARTNVSVVSLLSQFAGEHPIVKAITNSLNSIGSNFSFWFKGRQTPAEVADFFARDREALVALNQLIRRADLGILGVTVEQLFAPQPDKKEHYLFFEHAGLSRSLLHSFESHGTMNFVNIFPILYRTLASGGLALMDELDSDLHPELLREVTGWYNDPEINTQGSQLVMTCNNPAILDSLRKEEIFFASKDINGRTSLYSLKNIPGVRRGANFQRDYLAGRYGAVPHIG